MQKRLRDHVRILKGDGGSCVLVVASCAASTTDVLVAMAAVVIGWHLAN